MNNLVNPVKAEERVDRLNTINFKGGENEMLTKLAQNYSFVIRNTVPVTTSSQKVREKCEEKLMKIPTEVLKLVAKEMEQEVSLHRKTDLFCRNLGSTRYCPPPADMVLFVVENDFKEIAGKANFLRFIISRRNKPMIRKLSYEVNKGDKMVENKFEVKPCFNYFKVPQEDGTRKLVEVEDYNVQFDNVKGHKEED